MPQLWIIAGPNGAGKTTLVSDRLVRRIEVVNPDAIAAALPPVNGRPDERRAGEIAVTRRNELVADGADFAIETTLTGGGAMRLMRMARDAGYKITLVFVGLSSADLSAQRVLDRTGEGGHAVPIAALRRRYPRAIANLKPAMLFADRSYVYDNSGNRRRLLLIFEDGRTRYAVVNLPTWVADSVAGLPN